jgi:hypothetical protein
MRTILLSLALAVAAHAPLAAEAWPGPCAQDLKTVCPMKDHVSIGGVPAVGGIQDVVEVSRLQYR